MPARAPPTADRRPRIARVSRAYRCVRLPEISATDCTPCTLHVRVPRPVPLPCRRRAVCRVCAPCSRRRGRPRNPACKPNISLRRTLKMRLNGPGGNHLTFWASRPGPAHCVGRLKNRPFRQKTVRNASGAGGAAPHPTGGARRAYCCAAFVRTHATVCAAYTLDPGPPDAVSRRAQDM